MKLLNSYHLLTTLTSWHMAAYMNCLTHDSETFGVCQRYFRLPIHRWWAWNSVWTVWPTTLRHLMYLRGTSDFPWTVGELLWFSKIARQKQHLSIAAHTDVQYNTGCKTEQWSYLRPTVRSWVNDYSTGETNAFVVHFGSASHVSKTAFHSEQRRGTDQFVFCTNHVFVFVAWLHLSCDCQINIWTSHHGFW